MTIPSARVAAEPALCVPATAGGPVWVDADCVDPEFDTPVIDDVEDVAAPVPHRRVSGYFEGTDKRFNFYFPAKGKWQGRFFQLVYPLVDENAEPEDIEFGADSGAYTVQTNGGSGYRVDAAAAKFSEKVAADYYGTTEKIHGYLWGGSGGSYQTIGAMENSVGVWDGAVPFIPGVPVSIPNFFFIRAFARMVLHDKAPQIADAVSPGGSGDPYAGLDPTERSVLAEVTKLGIPLRAWEDYAYVLGLDDEQGLLGFADAVRGADPGYVEDFWNLPGYLGTERSPLGELFRAAVVDETVTVTRVERDGRNTPTELILESVPVVPEYTRPDFVLYAPDGTEVGSLTGVLDPAGRSFAIGSDSSDEVLRAIDVGARLRIDNRWDVALPAYPRYQVPQREGFYAFDQYRKSDGSPKYPQRPIEVGPEISTGVSGGGVHTGKINGKVIVVANLLDADAFPWDGDWYSRQVRQALGADFDGDFRVWFNDNADHIGPRTDRLVDYRGILEQALRDVSAWAEEGRIPPASTRYEITPESQVVVPETAGARHGIQPVVDLTVDGRDRVEISAGESVTLRAKIEVPPNAGKVVRAEWSRTGGPDFVAAETVGPARTSVEVTQSFTYETPGTYFPALRATSQRDEEANTSFAQIRNLGRVRVVVR
ncbi:hypothetical protein [Nocardia carnea]|uniref:hypothetical protein n=1 Tax=Nocardia carnea TaxID=37328 RepID=UPI002457834F|nr:hypothetical protein [Nocardia carnea]